MDLMKKIHTPMKKPVIILLALLLLLTCTACKKEASVGIIGGADGPTAILIKEQSDPEP